MAAEFPVKHYLNDGYGISSWLLTRDHKRIALLYLVAVTFFFFVGGAFAVLIRLDLATPAGDLVSDDTYNQLFTMHGVVMVFFFLIPAIPSILGNFLVPLMIARRISHFRSSTFHWYIYMRRADGRVRAADGGLDTVLDDVRPAEPKFATTRCACCARDFHYRLFVVLTGLNFIVTIHRMRARGMTCSDAALPVGDLRDEPHQHSRTPVIAITALLIVAERLFNFGFFDPSRGGDPVLFSIVLVLLASRGPTSWCCRRWGVSELVRRSAASPCSATVRRVLESRHRGARVPRWGTTFRGRHRSIVARVLAAELSGAIPWQ